MLGCRHRQHPFPRLNGAVERTEDFFSFAHVSLLPFSLFSAAADTLALLLHEKFIQSCPNWKNFIS